MPRSKAWSEITVRIKDGRSLKERFSLTTAMIKTSGEVLMELVRVFSTLPIQFPSVLVANNSPFFRSAPVIFGFRGCFFIQKHPRLREAQSCASLRPHTRRRLLPCGRARRRMVPGCRAWTRTKILAFKGLCPTVRRPGNIYK